MAADYSQIELRIAAALSKETAMIQAFEDGMDIHSATAMDGTFSGLVNEK